MEATHSQACESSLSPFACRPSPAATSQPEWQALAWVVAQVKDVAGRPLALPLLHSAGHRPRGLAAEVVHPDVAHARAVQGLDDTLRTDELASVGLIAASDVPSHPAP